MMFKKKTKTLDQILIESFQEDGRWIVERDYYLDTKTGAKLNSDTAELNGVKMSCEFQYAWWAWYNKPNDKRRADAKAALEKLYANY